MYRNAVMPIIFLHIDIIITILVESRSKISTFLIDLVFYEFEM